MMVKTISDTVNTMCMEKKRDSEDIAEYAVYGAKHNAVLVKKLVNEYFTSKKVSFFIENLNFNAIGSEIDGTSVISLYTLQKLYQQGKVKGVLIPSDQHVLVMRIMREKLLEIGIADEDIFAVPVIIFRKAILEDEEYREIFTPYRKLVQIYDLLFNIVEHCNLNCRSCMVFSNLVEGERIYDFELFTEDLKRCRKLVPSISSIGILGGEPFLNKDVCRYVRSLRVAYPYANITLTTNGFLLPTISGEIFDTLRDNNVTIKLSLYPPMKHKLDEFMAILRKNKMSFFVVDVNEFLKSYVRKPYFDKAQSASCCKYTCFGLRNGRLSRCERALYIEYFNKKFGVNLPDNAGIDIYDQSLTGEKLMRKLEEPLDLCSWCCEGLVNEWRPWELSGGVDVSEDYFVSCFDLIASRG